MSIREAPFLRDAWLRSSEWLARLLHGRVRPAVGARPELMIISTNDTVGGMQRVVLSMARILAVRGTRVQTLVPDTPGGARLRQWAHAERVPLEFSPAVLDASAPHGWRAMLALARLVRSRNPGAVNLHYGDVFISLKDVLAVRLAGLRRPCIVSVHHPTDWKHAGARKRRLTALAARLADVVVVNSGATHALMREAGIPTSKLRTVRLGVPVPPPSLEKVEARRTLGLPIGGFVVASLSRLEPHKGIHDLVQAIGALPPEVHLAVAGEGPERKRLDEEAARQPGDRFHFLGGIDDAQVLLAAADLFVLPSYLEGFGLVYIEAAMHGVPSIGCSVGGVPEAIADGETGLLVPPADVGALTVAIRRLWEDEALRLAMGRAARERALGQFTDASMVDGYCEVLALSPARPPA